MEKYYNTYKSEGILEYINEPDEFINELLKQFKQDYNIDLDFLADVNAYEEINDELIYNPIEVCLDKLQDDYNKYKLNYKSKETSLEDFIKNNRSSTYKDFRYLDISSNRNCAYYMINKSKLDKLILNHANKNSVNLEDLLKFRSIKSEITKINNIKRLKENKSIYKYIGSETTVKAGKGNMKIYPNSILLKDEILEKLFNINKY